MTIPTDDVLDDLEVSRAEPGPGYLERLFLRFNERVLFESATKIIRNSTASSDAEKPRLPEAFWADRLERGAGGTCFARVAAFEALLTELGFDVRRVLGAVRKEFDHAALVVDLGGRDGKWICDVGFPLPVLLPARAGGAETAQGGFSVRETRRGWRVDFEEGVPLGPRAVDIFAAPVDDGEFLARWQATFHGDSDFLREVVIHRLHDNRRTGFAKGELRIDDRHSRTRLPVAAPRAPALAEIFGIDAGLLSEALSLAGDPAPESGDASVEVYLESTARASDAWAAVASPEGWAALHGGVADVSCEPTGPRAWRARFSAPGEASGGFEENLSADDSSRILSARRGTSAGEWAVEEHAGTVWLVRRTKLEGSRPDLLRNDSLRGRFAGSLAIDLLAWARRIPPAPGFS